MSISSIKEQLIIQMYQSFNMTSSKRNLPRREIPWISTTLEKFSFSKLPTNGVVLRRLMFELEQNTSISVAAVTVKNELVELWEYAGYGDILQHPAAILRNIKTLRDQHGNLSKIPLDRRQKEAFKKKEAEFLASMGKLGLPGPLRLQTTRHPSMLQERGGGPSTLRQREAPPCQLGASHAL
jgi:hypothetical protein